MEKPNKRNRIIIIGNGFDLAHGLKTSYRNFIDWLWDKKVEEINEVKKMIKSKSRIVDKDNLFIVDVGERNEFNSADELKRWITYKNGLLETLEKKRSELKDPKWSDIEDVYYDCLLKCNNHFGIEKEEKNYEELSIIRLNREFRVLRAKLLEYLQSVYDSADKDRPEFIKLTHRMKKIFEAKDNNGYEIEKTVFISFNYTPTLESNGYLDSSEKKKGNAEIIYIHGNLKDRDSIIFGYGDELDSNSLNIQENKDNAFLEFNKAVLYARSGEYQRIVPYIYGSNDYEVYILGHSCANSDRALLNEIFDNEHCKLIKYYYYSGSPGIEVNFKEQISNLYRIFGENHRGFRAIFCPLHESERIPQISDIENFIVDEEPSASTNTVIEILGVQFVKVKGGCLDDGTKVEDFWIGKYPVTELQWKNIIGENVDDEKGDDFPVVGIKYGECLKFVGELASQSGRAVSLPTEEQWMFAARGGNNSKNYIYAGSNNIDEVGWYKGNSEGHLHPVGKKKPNELGIYDMSGNVWEYTKTVTRSSINKNGINLIKLEELEEITENKTNEVVYAKDVLSGKMHRMNFEEAVIKTFKSRFLSNVVCGGGYLSINSHCRTNSKKGIERPAVHVGFRVVINQE